MGRGRRATSAIKTLKDNYRLKDGVRNWKIRKKNKKKCKYMKLDFLSPCYFHSSFFSLRGALARSHTSSNIGYFQPPPDCIRKRKPKNQTKILSFLSSIPLFFKRCLKMAFHDSYPFPSQGGWMKRLQEAAELFPASPEREIILP